MNILITGATGMVGAEVVRQAIQDPSIENITLLIRRPSEFHDPRVTEVILKDFLNYSSVEYVFANNDACLWCLGISQSRVSKKDYYKITYEYTMAAARAMKKVNPTMSFLFLSGEGADSTEKSPVRFAKVKGQTENGLQKLQLKNLYIFRPGGISPTTRSRTEGWYKKFEIFMVKAMKTILPWAVVSTKQLSKAMLQVAREGFPKIILTHKDIKAL
ncbi:MAG: NAD(P)H-binding protein [Flavitalea sp.]